MTDTASGIRSVQCRAALRAIREQFGYSLFRETVYNLERERLQTDPQAREKRKRFKPQTYRFLYHRQRGICPLCNLGMVMPRVFPGELEIDHIDPNRDDFGTDSNLQLTHGKCNRGKGSKSIQEQSKATGKPFTELLAPIESAGDPSEEDEEPLRAFPRKIMD